MTDEIARVERTADALQSEAMITADPLRRVVLFCASSNMRMRALWMMQKYEATDVHRALAMAEAEAQTMLEMGGPQ